VSFPRRNFMSRSRLLTGGLLSSSLIVATVLWASAQEVQVERPRGRVAAAAGIRRTSVVIGATVSIENNVSAGKVEDLVINDNGCIDYMVVLNEDKYVLVPWTAATIDFDRRSV